MLCCFCVRVCIQHARATFASNYQQQQERLQNICSVLFFALNPRTKDDAFRLLNILMPVANVPPRLSWLKKSIQHLHKQPTHSYYSWKKNRGSLSYVFSCWFIARLLPFVLFKAHHFIQNYYITLDVGVADAQSVWLRCCCLRWARGCRKK